MSVKPWRLAVCLFAAALPAAAQSNLAQLAPQPDVLSLQTWRIHPGDDMRWASPAFDDSRWQTVSYPVQEPSAKLSGGFHWYRTTVSLPPSLQGRDLAIGIGPLDEVYDIYVEGVLVGRFGHWTPKPESPFNRNLSFPIPAGTVSSPVVHIAIRRWTGASTSGLFPYYTSGMARFPHSPELGTRAAISARTSFYIAAGIIHNIPWNLCLLAVFVAGCIALVLFSAQRNHTEYLFLGIYCIGLFLDPLIGSLVASSDSIMRRSWGPILVYFGYTLFETCSIVFLAQLCPRFRRWLLAGAVIVFLVSCLAVYSFAAQSAGGEEFVIQNGSYLVVALDLLAAWELFRERKTGSVAIASALVVVQIGNAWVNTVSHRLHMTDLRFMSVGPVFIDIRSITQTFFLLVTLMVLYLRYRQNQIRQVALEQDMASARRMQEQLLGGKALYVPGFDLEAVYLPAKEVGGDFYRVVPLEDGALLVVVGDVSGKGLDAAMLVAAILGSLANETHRSPASLLGYLNKAVAGRTGGGFITACCARFYPDGQAVISNAGHISPYLNGSEIELENGLPLGIKSDAVYSETSIPSDGTFTFVSDGVVEARAASGELLGFERMAAMATQPAAEVAAAAQRWGQEDDITVLTVTPLPA